ncbi:DUF3331 domain-containing protein [Paraburkholderia bryophila]|uniref:Uncharacterized protein DUF3331 n=1 Tax=Paraburkholderia bryophila TaxID=420952 RepID=A0A329C6H7_9BURK|nr:DUF3331 domain-containing protein [Paraburkholderia bryophila]RAS29780.1 uncharacterized protein DUF3331 [Paraburkholderia bryophila]
MCEGNTESTQCFVKECRISLLERPKTDRLVVDWSDACRGHCGEQEWRMVAAPTSGRCAFSGAEIRKGDPVFKPKRSQASPNADEMILASAVPESIEAGDGQLTEHPYLVT